MNIFNDKQNELRDLEESEWVIGAAFESIGNAKLRVCGNYEGKNVRVEQIGPYRIAFKTNDDDVLRISYEGLKDSLDSLQDMVKYPIYIGGSQSPLSMKMPNKDSDIDVYIVTPELSYEECVEIKATIREWEKVHSHKFSVGLVEEDWLQLPYFYEAVPLSEAKWWEIPTEKCEEYALKRKKDSINTMANLREEDIILWINKIFGCNYTIEDVIRISTTPRWKSINDCNIKHSP